MCVCVRWKFVGVPEVPLEAVDCSNTGVGQLLGKALQLKNIRTQRLITAKFDLPVSLQCPFGLCSRLAPVMLQPVNHLHTDDLTQMCVCVCVCVCLW